MQGIHRPQQTLASLDSSDASKNAILVMSAASPKKRWRVVLPTLQLGRIIPNHGCHDVTGMDTVVSNFVTAAARIQCGWSRYTS